MMRFNDRKKWMVVVLAVAFVFSVLLSPAMATGSKMEKGDAKAAKTVLQGSGMMMKGEKELLSGLTKQDLAKDPKLANGIKTMNDGEKMIVQGSKLFKEKSGQVKGKELILSGSTKMMEGKDAIVAELHSRGMMQEGKIVKGEELMKKGDQKMMEGKNMMMDGFKNMNME